MRGGAFVISGHGTVDSPVFSFVQACLRRSYPVNVGAKWVGPRGWEFEHIVLDGRECIRVRHHGAGWYFYSEIEFLRFLAEQRLTLDQFDEVTDS